MTRYAVTPTKTTSVNITKNAIIRSSRSAEYPRRALLKRGGVRG
jgi:hypothetical protein